MRQKIKDHQIQHNELKIKYFRLELYEIDYITLLKIID
jgi:hypothetical protein